MGHLLGWSPADNPAATVVALAVAHGCRDLACAGEKWLMFECDISSHTGPVRVAETSYGTFARQSRQPYCVSIVIMVRHAFAKTQQETFARYGRHYSDVSEM